MIIRILTNPRTLCCIMIVLSILASIAYGCQRDWRHCVYWAAAAILNISVTF